MAKYNGWTNYETWVVNLWMDNDPGEYERWREVAREHLDAASEAPPLTRMQAAAIGLADELKEQADEELPDVDGFWKDLLLAALSEVNWYEIARCLIEEVAEVEV
jgi:hypothetical protein